jgi:hypothetical protein
MRNRSCRRNHPAAERSGSEIVESRAAPEESGMEREGHLCQESV